MPEAVIWRNADRCCVGGVEFQLLPVDLLAMEKPTFSMDGADFFLFKETPGVERYVELVERLRPQTIFELGIFAGGSAAFLYELARPERLTAVDIRPPRGKALRRYRDDGGGGDALRIHDDVDQADRDRLAQIVADDFGDRPLDLVIDDCSHQYEPTRASFNELFPRLRPGGVYVIEDWPWAEIPAIAAAIDDTVIPLSRFVCELVLALPAHEGLITEIRVDRNAVILERGDAEVDPSGFEVVT